VDVDGLARHVGDKVPEITQTLYGVRQDPIRKLTGNNFPLGMKILDIPKPIACEVSDQG
jgi:hypothetical protein